MANNNEWGKIFDAIDDWICIIGLDATILRSNKSVEKHFQLREYASVGLKCCKLIHGTDSFMCDCPLPKMLKTKKREYTEEKSKDNMWLGVTIDPIFDKEGDLVAAVHIAHDISQRIQIQNEKNGLIHDLKTELTKLKPLSGLIPICSNCKKIRDTLGAWNHIESYIQNHCDVSFSHGMCPDCLEKTYGNEGWYIDMKKTRKDQ